MLSQGVAGSSLDQGSTPTPPTRSFVSQVKPAFLPLIALRLRDTWFVYEVDPVVHEPLYPLDGVAWRRNAMPSPPFRLWTRYPVGYRCVGRLFGPAGQVVYNPAGCCVLAIPRRIPKQRYPVGHFVVYSAPPGRSFITPPGRSFITPPGTVYYPVGSPDNRVSRTEGMEETMVAGL